MNYIKQLQEENKEKAEEIQALRDGLADLLRYVQSDKFTSCGGELENYVNIKDVALRINEITG